MKYFIRLVISIVGIILISGLPVLITGILAGNFNWREYFTTIEIVLRDLWPLHEFAIENYRIGKMVPVFPQILEYMAYSLEILFLALAVSVIGALAFAILTMLFSEKVRERIKMTLYFMEAIPDLLIILLAQLGIVLIYQQTGVLISKIAAIGDERIYWLPVLCLAILPTIQLYRLCMLTFQEEERQMYVDLARSLGFSKIYIILVHMFRNAVISVFFQSKKAMWFMLSNLFILELMFNLPGIMLFLRDNMSPQVFILTVFCFFLPMFFLYSLGEWFFIRRLRGKEAI